MLPPLASPRPRRAAAIGAIATLLVVAGGCAVSFRELPEPVDACVYVSPSLGDDAKGDGTRAHPVASIAQAISVAQAKMFPAVCLSGEMYREQVTVVSGISIYGGFDQGDPDAPFIRSDKVTTTVAAQGFVFSAPEIDQETHIERIRIVALSDGRLGASTYGVKLGGGKGELFLRSNSIVVEGGGDGASGDDATPLVPGSAPEGNAGAFGAPQNPAAGGGGPAPQCSIPGGQGGHGGADVATGEPGSAGRENPKSGGAAGAASCAVGMCGAPAGDGAAGSKGDQGSPGKGGVGLGVIAALDYTPAHGGDGANGGNGAAGGGGGGGGGGPALCFFGISFEGGGGGSGGCGGIGGDFGRGGKGAGGSFGIFAASGKIIVTGNAIVTAKGGAGGDGGNGTHGQHGGAGGGRGGCTDAGGSGGQGGKGGDGGAGGPGGGGGGGPSACLGRGSSVIATFDLDANSCTTGLPGVGGKGGKYPSGDPGNAGAPGTAAPILSIP